MRKGNVATYRGTSTCWDLHNFAPFNFYTQLDLQKWRVETSTTLFKFTLKSGPIPAQFRLSIRLHVLCMSQNRHGDISAVWRKRNFNKLWRITFTWGIPKVYCIVTVNRYIYSFNTTCLAMSSTGNREKIEITCVR